MLQVPFFDGDQVQLENTTGKNCLSYSGREASFLRYQGRIDVGPADKLFQASLLEGVRFPVGMIHEDQAVIPLLIYKAARVCLLDSALYFYRIHKDSITNRGFSLKRYDNIKLMNGFIHYLETRNDTELASKAKIHRDNTLAEYTIQAKMAGIDEIPNEYRMSEWKAFSILRDKWSNDKYDWYLSQLHPHWLRPHTYLRKMISILTGKTQ